MGFNACTVHTIFIEGCNFFRQFSWPTGMRHSFLNYYPPRHLSPPIMMSFIFSYCLSIPRTSSFSWATTRVEKMSLRYFAAFNAFQPIPILFFELFYWLILTSHTIRPTLHDYVKCAIVNYNCFIRLTTWCCWECHFRPPTWRYPRPPWY